MGAIWPVPAISRHMPLHPPLAPSRDRLRLPCPSLAFHWPSTLISHEDGNDDAITSIPIIRSNKTMTRQSIYQVHSVIFAVRSIAFDRSKARKRTAKITNLVRDFIPTPIRTPHRRPLRQLLYTIHSGQTMAGMIMCLCIYLHLKYGQPWHRWHAGRGAPEKGMGGDRDLGRRTSPCQVHGMLNR